MIYTVGNIYEFNGKKYRLKFGSQKCDKTCPFSKNGKCINKNRKLFNCNSVKFELMQTRNSQGS